MIRGCDASAVQGAIPLWHTGPELRFVILKAAQGNDGFDSFFKRNVDAALSEGREPFPYCFAYPLPGSTPGRDPKEQAKLFVDRTLGASRAMEGRPFFLDYEWPEPNLWKKWGCSASQIADWCAANAEEVERLTAVTPVIYTYPYWWHAIGSPAWAAHYPLWIASYPTEVGWPKEGDQPVIPKPWSSYTFWQFDGNGGLRLPNGVDCDFCVFAGDEADLQKFAGKTVVRRHNDDPLGEAASCTVNRK